MPLLAGDRDPAAADEAAAEPVPAAKPPPAVAADVRDVAVAGLVDHDDPREVDVDLPEKGLERGADLRVGDLVLVLQQPLAVLETEELAAGPERHQTALVGLAVDAALRGLQDGREPKRDRLLGGVVPLDRLDRRPVRLDLLERRTLERRHLDDDLVVGQPEAVAVLLDRRGPLDELVGHRVHEVRSLVEHQDHVLAGAALGQHGLLETDAALGTNVARAHVRLPLEAVPDLRLRWRDPGQRKYGLSWPYE